MGIRTKILFWFSLFGVIPAILIGVYYGYQSERSIERKVLDMSLDSARQTMTAINDRILYIEKSLHTSIQNDVVMETLDALPHQDVVTSSFEERKIAKHFNAVAFNSPYVKSIALVPLNSDTIVYGEGTSLDRMSAYVRFFLDEEFRQTPLYRKISKAPNQMEWAVLQIGGEPQICLVKSFSYFLYAKPMGTIVFVVDAGAFEDYILSSSGVNSFIVTSDNMDLHTMQPATDAFADDTPDGQQVLLREGAAEFTVHAPLSNGWRYGSVISKDYLYEDIRQTRTNTFFFVILTSAVFLVMAFFTSISIGNRINCLIKKFQRLETGDFTVDTVLSGNDEMVMIEKGYNQMLTQLSQLIDQNYVYKLEKQEALLTALQYQINPHFLYNILEVINSMAAVRQAEDIREVAQSMGRLYRYNMNSSKDMPTTLGDELTHIQNYTHLQNIQMSGRLQVFCDVQEAARSCHVIRFILQPVVENAIKHGFVGKSGMCCIEISAAIVQEQLCVVVADDGNGISEETLEGIRRALSGQEDGSCAHSGGIGLKNVNARIRLRYGPAYGVTIESELGGGTRITLLLPAREQGEQKGES